MNGLLDRLLFNGNNLIWDGAAFASYNPIVYAGTLLSFVAFVGFSLLFPWGKQRKSGVVNESLFGQGKSALRILLLCLIQNPEIIDLFLIPHDLPINFAPLRLSLLDAESSSLLIGFVKQAQLVGFLPL
jgi:hypothetical protein